MIITQGKQGAVGFSTDTGFVNCPAFANKVIDRVGAGECVAIMLYA